MITKQLGSLTDNNSRIYGWDLSHDWQRSQQLNQVPTQGHEFLIRQVVHEDIRYFSYKMRKD